MRKPWRGAVSARSAAKGIKNWFTNKPQAALGVDMAGNCIYMSLVGETENGELHILWQDAAYVDCQFAAVEEYSSYKSGREIEGAQWSEEDLWELAFMKAADHVPEHIICCLALGDDQVYYYERFFPEMQSKELSQAVRLDFVASSAWQEKFYCSYQAVGQGMLRVGGIKARELEERLRALKNEYTFAQGVLVCHGDEAKIDVKATGDIHTARESVNTMTETRAEGVGRQAQENGFQRAAYAAVCGLSNQGMVFRPYQEYLCQWNWLHLTQALWGAAMVAFAIFWGTGWYMQQNIDNQLEQAKSRLQLLSDIDDRERKISGDRKVIAQKNKLLAQLGEAPRNGQNLLVKLGYGLEDDVWLTRIKTLEDGSVSIQGRGALYEHISAMLDRLNSSKSVGENPMILEDADMGQDGRIDFRLRGKV